MKVCLAGPILFFAGQVHQQVIIGSRGCTCRTGGQEEACSLQEFETHLSLERLYWYASACPLVSKSADLIECGDTLICATGGDAKMMLVVCVSPTKKYITGMSASEKKRRCVCVFCRCAVKVIFHVRFCLCPVMSYS